MNAQHCKWFRKVWASGRHSTMFFYTTCRIQAAIPTRAKYCYNCGKLMKVMEPKSSK